MSEITMDRIIDQLIVLAESTADEDEYEAATEMLRIAEDHRASIERLRGLAGLAELSIDVRMARHIRQGETA